MSILTKREILNLLYQKQIEFTPAPDQYQIQPCSVDLRAGWSYYSPLISRYNEKGRLAVIADYLDYTATNENFKLLKLSPGQYFEILPNESIIASSLEKVCLNTGKVMGILYPRSSSSRRGLAIESGIINPHYHGHLIIPMTNNSHHVIKIYPGERLCQLVFHELNDNLLTEETTKHGLQEEKYQNATPYGLEIKPDAQLEMDLLKQGRLEDLKNQFQIVI